MYELKQAPVAVSLIADMVAVQVLHSLAAGQMRFGALAAALRGVSSKTLAHRLKRLEREGMLTRTVHAQVPVRVEYALTPKGTELLSILEGIAQWERSWA
jgi:DNA-binding HxlR family transcriptional regulator